MAGGYEDSQPDGPEPEPWISNPVTPRPHGFVEPSKWELLGGTYRARERQWKHLLADMEPSNTVWWGRLMRFMSRRTNGRDDRHP